MMEDPFDRAGAPGSFEGLATELVRLFGAESGRTWPDGAFNDLALRVFSCQFDRVPAFRAFCEGRDRTPANVRRWEDVPAVPATAFKHLDFIVGEPKDAEAVFRTSGTTLGGARRGRHPVRSLALYRASLLPWFRAHLLPRGERPAFLSLVPPPTALPDSSLSFMVGAAAERFAGETHWLVDAEGAVDLELLATETRRAARSGAPVLLLGTALAFEHVLDASGGRLPHRLPSGSRVMETGGFKGAARETTKEELQERIAEGVGVPVDRIVDEYGMTELLSQLYEPVLTEGRAAVGSHVAPPWLRVRALDPETLDVLPDGEVGILAFYDLANAGSVSHVLTEDLGSVREGRVRLAGRRAGSEPRGCSRAMDELMSGSRSP